MRLIQFKDAQGVKAALVDDTDQVSVIEVVGGTYALAMMAVQHGVALKDLIQQHLGNQVLSYQDLIDSQRLLPPLTHPDAAHCLVSGTGLTHLGSADTRDAMHAKLSADDADLSDSMRMFKMGLEGGRPATGQVGVQPEWFYKGDGDSVVAPECALPVPGCAQDAGEEPELVGLYVIAPDGTPVRVGFAVGNEFSDHVTERHNYLWLAHSKLRACSFGPEILIGELPADLRGDPMAVDVPMRSGVTQKAPAIGEGEERPLSGRVRAQGVDHLLPASPRRDPLRCSRAQPPDQLAQRRRERQLEGPRRMGPEREGQEPMPGD